MERTRIGRRRRGAGTLGALVRALLLFGPLGVGLALATLAGSGEGRMRSLAMGGSDDLTTGSIVAPVLPAVRTLADRPNGGPCLRFPDGSQRGDC